MTRFVYFNNNPEYRPSKNGKIKNWYRNDCTTRAISCALNLRWKDVLYEQFKYALQLCDMPDSIKVVNETLVHYGFVKHSYPRGQKRETVDQFCKNHPKGIFILNLAGHLTCVKDGLFYDVWDCSHKTAYNYYEISLENKD